MLTWNLYVVILWPLTLPFPLFAVCLPHTDTDSLWAFSFQMDFNDQESDDADAFPIASER